MSDACCFQLSAVMKNNCWVYRATQNLLVLHFRHLLEANSVPCRLSAINGRHASRRYTRKAIQS
jgi:hypothetical protein